MARLVNLVRFDNRASSGATAGLQPEERARMQCPACKETIIEGAKVCRFCGRKQSRSLSAGCLTVIGVLALITLLPILFVSFSSPGTSTKEASGASSSAGSAKNVQEDFERVNPSFLAAVLPCQIGFTAAGKALHSGDRYKRLRRRPARPAGLHKRLGKRECDEVFRGDPAAPKGQAQRGTWTIVATLMRNMAESL